MKTTAFFTVLMACSLTAVSAASVTGSKSRRAMVGEQLILPCTVRPACKTHAQCNASLYKETRGTLEKVSVNKIVVLQYSASMPKKNFTRVEFTMDVTEESNGTYRCMVREQLSPQFDIRVCQEPVLVLRRLPDTHPNVITVNVSEECQFSGAISWLVNGYQVERESFETQEKIHTAIQNNDDLVELYNSEECEPQSVCRVTSIFTYIQDRRITTFNRSREIQDCCVNMPNEEPATQSQPQTSTVTVSPKASMSPKEEIWALRRDVLRWKKKVLPFQLRLLKRWSKDLPRNPDIAQLLQEDI